MHSAQRSKPRYNKSMKNILIFGASIVHGVGAAKGGWADHIKQGFHAEMYGPGGRGDGYCDVYELGIPGGAMPDLLARFEDELRARVGAASGSDIYVVFSAGTNDSRWHRDTAQHLFSADDFAANVHAFIHLAKEYTDNILAVGVTPIDEAKLPIENEQQRALSNERIRSFEQALQRTCDNEGVQFVPIFDRAPADWAQAYLSQDGVHPSDAGHEWIRSQVEPELRNMLEPAA